MKTLKFVVSIFISLIVLGSSLSVYAYDDRITHTKITEQAVSHSTLGVFLIQNFGNRFTQGIESQVNGKSVLKWFIDGSELEDSLHICRASNHFHNPLITWEQSYMSDEPWWIATYCGATGYGTKYSSVTWGTGYLSLGGSKTAISSQEWGWDNARSYYYLALTSTSNLDREKYFANTFQALGQVLHLIEDGAQPGHVRNDFRSHLTYTGIEFSAPWRWIGSQFEHYVKSNPALVTSATPSELPSFTRLTDFWDTDQYTGQNPATLTSLSLGVTEFTNANYFSDFTIPNNNPTPEHTFPYPLLTYLQERLSHMRLPVKYHPAGIEKLVRQDPHFTTIWEVIFQMIYNQSNSATGPLVLLLQSGHLFLVILHQPLIGITIDI